MLNLIYSQLFDDGNFPLDELKRAKDYIRDEYNQVREQFYLEMERILPNLDFHDRNTPSVNWPIIVFGYAQYNGNDYTVAKDSDGKLIIFTRYYISEDDCWAMSFVSRNIYTWSKHYPITDLLVTLYNHKLIALTDYGKLTNLDKLLRKLDSEFMVIRQLIESRS